MQIETRRSESAGHDQDSVRRFFEAGSRAVGEYHCAVCGYGVAVRSVLPACPMCRGLAWEEREAGASGRSFL